MLIVTCFKAIGTASRKHQVRRKSTEEIVDIFEHLVGNSLSGFAAGPGDMGCQNKVRTAHQPLERMIGRVDGVQVAGQQEATLGLGADAERQVPPVRS